MARAYDRAGDEVTAQASNAITADAMSGGVKTDINIESGGNADGANWLDCYIDVTAAPGSEASCELYLEGSPDGANFAGVEYALTCKVPVAIGRYHLGPLMVLPRNMRLSIKAIAFGFTASLSVVPRYIADA